MVNCDALFEYLGIQLPGTESKDLHVTFLAASVYKYWTEGGPVVISLPLQERVGSPSTATGASSMDKAELYEQANGLQRYEATAALEELVDALDWSVSDQHVLDVGCGSGDVTAEVLLPRLPADAVSLCVGADVSAAMLRHATQRHGHPGLLFHALDIADPLVNKSALWKLAPFHKVFSFFCLHWVQCQSQALENIHKLLRPKGEALLVFLASCPIFRVYEALAAKPRWNQYMQDVAQFISPYHHCKDPEETFSSLAKRTGFSVEICRCDTRSYSFGSISALQESMNAVNPFIDRVPLALREDFVMDSLYETHRLNLIKLEEVKSFGAKRATTQYRVITVVIKKL